MTAQDFFNKYNNKYIDFDGYYGYQCMDLYQQYNKEVVGAPSVAAPYAKDVWNKNLYPSAFYTKVKNTPDGVPQIGDVIIWDGPVNGGPGHIAVYQKGDVWNFTSFDQNWPVNSKCHSQSHNYNYVLGWLRPKTDKLISGNQIKSIIDGPGSDGDKLISIKKLL